MQSTTMQIDSAYTCDVWYLLRAGYNFFLGLFGRKNRNAKWALLIYFPSKLMLI